MLYRKKLFPCLWQSLEPRSLLAFASLSPADTLIVTGTAQANQIMVSQAGANLVATMDGSTMQFAVAAVKGIFVDAGAGDDSVLIGVNIDANIVGGEGNDRLTGGPGDDTLDGDAGDDTINAEAGTDTVTGGEGIDTLEYGDRSEGFGIQIGFTNSPQTSLTFAVAASGDTDHGTDYFEVIGGSEFDDGFGIDIDYQHTVPPPSITFLGRGGNDRFIFFGIPPDFPVLMAGGPGNDSFPAYSPYASHLHPPTLLGGPGNDRFDFYDAPLPVLDGGPGGDTLDITDARALSVDLNQFPSVENVVGIGSLSTVMGTDSANYFAADTELGVGNYRSFALYAKGGNDTIVGSPGRDYLDGGDGDDSIDGGGGNDTLLGGVGNDMLIGNAGNDKLYGGAGNDTLLGGPGRDRMYGEAGDDLFAARDKKRDTLYGGDGTDSATIENKGTIKDLYHEIETLV